MHKALIATSSVLALLMSPVLAQAQQGSQGNAAQNTQQKSGTQTATAPSTKDMKAMKNMKVDMQEMYKGMRAENVIGLPVYGAQGGSIGEVENILVNSDEMATALIVEAGGFLDIGDAHFRVPFEDVNFTPFKDGLKIPITEAAAEKWGLFDGDEEVSKAPREFRITEVIGDYARLKNGAAFGYVDDVVLDSSGRLQAVVINGARRYGYGLYAYPFYGYPYGFDPGLDHIVLPIDTADEAKKAEKVDKEKFDKTAYNKATSKAADK